ncbi:MAG: iron-sulfur cluster assembly scaffold protein [Steroidobacteraceae bacterium]|jgi:NifU-like protein involved in Fe-S cluster formation
MNYSDLTRRYFETARAAGVLSGNRVGRGAAGSRRGGTWVQFDIELEPAPYPERRIAAARFLAFACPHTIAVAAWVAERAVGEVCAAGLPESVHAISRRFEVPAEKLGRLLIVEDAWAAAVAAAKLRVTM